jgi:hypothetical protein
MQHFLILMKAQERYYRSFLVRLWKEYAKAEWRASIQDIASGECRYFPNLNELFMYLEQIPETTTPDRPFATTGPPELDA